MHRRTVLLVLLLASMGAIASWLAWHAPFLKKAEGAAGSAQPAIGPDVKEPAAKGNSSPQQAVTQQPQQAVHSVGNFAEGLAGAADLRQFALNAIRKPEFGGVSYAGYAIHLCRVYYTLHAASGLKDRNGIPYDPKEDSSLYAKRVSYMQAAERRCASFSPDELSSDKDVNLAEREKQERDKHAVIKERYEIALKSGDESSRLRVAAEVLELRDPLLLASMGHRMMLGRENGRMGYSLDGVFYPVNSEEGGSLQIALDLLPCRFGLPCDTTDVNVVQACITHSQCFANKEDFLTSELSEENRQRVSGFLRRLTEVVNSSDANAFRRGG